MYKNSCRKKVAITATKKKTNKNTGSELLPANQQKGKKRCTCCREEYKMTDFYLSLSPMYALDQRVPVCKECCKTSALREDGTINYEKLNELLRNIDKPLYYDQLYSAEESVKKENSYLSDKDVRFHGSEILSKYFTLIAMRQDKSRSYSDSEKEGFIHQNTNRSQDEITYIRKKYAHLLGPDNNKKSKTSANKKVSWSEQDLKNIEYAIDIIGYDPFEEYPEEDRKFLFNQLSPYLEDEDISDDAYKLSQILQIINNNNQINICDKRIANLDPIKDAADIKTLNTIKKDLVASNDKIAKENEISVKNRSNKDVGKSTLTYLMRDLREKDFDKAEADYYDQLRGAGTQWAISISQKALLDHCLFDENDKREIYETQLKLIDDLYKELDDKKEQIRQLLAQVDTLNSEIAHLKEVNYNAS